MDSFAQAHPDLYAAHLRKEKMSTLLKDIDRQLDEQGLTRIDLLTALGHPPKTPKPDRWSEYKRHFELGETPGEIAKAMGVSRQAVHQARAKWEALRKTPQREIVKSDF